MEHRYPSLYQINTRVLLNELSRGLQHRPTLDDISDEEPDRLAFEGFDWLWFLGVWQTGLAGQDVSRAKTEWQAEFRAAFPADEQLLHEPQNYVRMNCGSKAGILAYGRAPYFSG
jgi:hypothetical protein